MSWSYDQTLIAKYYNLYLKIMNFWKSKFNDFIFDANYENIVTSPELEVKKMLSFCDLNWEPECLNFYQNKKTPFKLLVSLRQVNQFTNLQLIQIMGFLNIYQKCLRFLIQVIKKPSTIG